MTAKGKFGTGINCMDGRVQLPVIEWMIGRFGLDYVDSITDPGPDGIVSRKSGEALDYIKKRVLVSVNAHGSKIIAVAGHHDCAGNPVSDEEHKRQVKESVRVIRSWGLPVEKVVGLWLGSDWEPEVVIED